MEQEALTIEKQQKMLMRSIRDIQAQIDKTLKSGLMQDFEELEYASRTFKDYVRLHVTAPEIRLYMDRIPEVRNRKSSGAILGTIIGLFVSWVGGAMVSHLQEQRELESLTHELRGHYGNLEVLVMLMEPD